ncbi:FIMAH domain-containing protein [Paenibacillus contaminans]|uniref:FIMAH domain-containing protein n=1 Tax=Paenibacillus contaminans TaxID=450362 RepID=A0A329MH73_9BACL|nr:heparinase II/III family protein [Paenibacillus contaminans]RAV19249.1 hypothetical protein DQG23_22200 [Paenibacillus contaminans]
MNSKLKRMTNVALSFVLLLIAFTGSVTVGSKKAEASFWTDPYAHLANGKLQLKGPANAHDLLLHALNWQNTPGTVVAEADIEPVTNPGGTWAPSLALYWDTAKYVSIGVSVGGEYTLMPGGRVGTAPLGKTYRVRIVWENGNVQLWGSEKGTPPVLLHTASAPASGPPPYLIVGKGYGSTSAPYTNAFLANDFTSLGTNGSVYMDNVAVYADGASKLDETFANGIDFSRWRIVTSPANGATPWNDPYAHVWDGKLQFKGPVNAHDLLYQPFNWQSAPGTVVAEADIEPVTNPGSTWAPSLTLYWDTARFVSIGISGSGDFTLVPGGRVGTAPLGKTYRVRIVWENGNVQLWGSEKGTPPVLLHTASAPASGPPQYLIVGKGYGSTYVPYTNAFLANDFTNVGTNGNVYMDNVAVYADGALRIDDSFTNGVDFSRWQLLKSGLFQAVTIENLFPNWVTPAERGAASPPKVLYKQELWDDYYTNVQSSAELQALADAQIAALVSDVALAMSYNDAQIANMIPVTTPNADLFTPCPSDPNTGFPHGSWRWDPQDPDVIYCKDKAYPNAEYPEEGVLIANWGGLEQRITFYNRETYVFNGFKLNPSFTSYIRAKKVTYMSEIVRKIAMLYKLTGDTSYAQQGKKILLRFAEVYPHWLLHSGYGEFADMDPKEAAFRINKLPNPELTWPGNVPDKVLHAGYWAAGRGNANGIEGYFILPLVVAYDLLGDVQAGGQALLTSAERLAIERDLLLESASLLMADRSMNNKTIHNLTAAAAIGIAVGEPTLVQLGVQAFNQFLSEWFKADGSTIETPAYGMQVFTPLFWLGEILNGYSDPVGYVLPGGARTDNFPVYERSAYRMVFKAMGEALLPSMNYPSVGDSYTTSRPYGYWFGSGAKQTGIPLLSSLFRYGGFVPIGAYSLMYRPDDLEQTEPLLLPDVLFPQWKLAYLRGGTTNSDSAAILNASDWGTHHHLDSLDLSYWANGGESLSDLGYLWDNPQQAMTVRSAAHNLVVVNQKDQKMLGRGGSIGFYEMPGSIHATEASSSAYAETDVYSRTLLQLQKTDNKPEYLVDLFRVRGGNTHDYILHGSTDSLTTSGIQLGQGGDSAVTAYGLTNVQTAGTDQVWTAGWENAGGAGQTQVWQVPMTVSESVYIGEGWGQRGVNDAGAQLPYLVRRLNNSTGGSTFASVIESYSGAPGIQHVEPLTVSGNVYRPAVDAPVGLQIGGNGWHDYVFSSQGSSAVPADFAAAAGSDPIAFGGRYGVLSYKDDNGSSELQYAFLAGEGKIEQDGLGISIEAGQQKEGSIVQRLQDGFVASGIVADAETWIGSHVLVKKGADWTAYPVLDVQTEAGNTRFVTYTPNEGFPFDGGEAWKLIPYAVAKRNASGAWEIAESAGVATLINNVPITVQSIMGHVAQLAASGDVNQTFAAELSYRLNIIRILEEQGAGQIAVAYMQDFLNHINAPAVQAQQLVSAQATAVLNGDGTAFMQSRS